MPFHPQDLLSLLLQLAINITLAWLVGRHFVHFGQVLSNRRRLARVLVFVSATTLLIISVVKVSVALSLGLVGALSIIRFRTPIKEPEELAYLFLAVAIGVGVGADRAVETAVAVLVILLAMTCIGRARGQTRPGNAILHIASRVNTSIDVAQLTATLGGQCARADLRRVDLRENTLEADFHVELNSPNDAQQLLAAVARELPGAEVSLVDRTGLD